MHSCGAVSSFVPYMIEMGVDALNPVQVSAEGMNPADLVRQYGKRHRLLGRRMRHAARPECLRPGSGSRRRPPAA